MNMSENVLKLSNEKIAKNITKDMVGLFFEDINCAADGGLYAEMLENRSFEAIKTKGTGRNYVMAEDNLYAWGSTDQKSQNLEISMNMPVSEKNPHYLRFTAEKPGEGFYNKAYEGISLTKGQKYNLSFYAREVFYKEGEVQILITKDGKTYAETTVGLKFITEPDGYNQMIGKCESKEWHLYKAQLTAQDDVHGARFEMHLTKEGSYEFDLISLIPQDAVAGVFRKDLFEALKNLNPAFLRFPGGCIVEGTSLLHRYEWKKTVGELKDRKIKPNLWATQGGNAIKAWETSDCHYMQSYGIGFYEYFVLCELLSSEKRKCKALPVLNIGVACQFRSYQTVPVDSEEFQEYVQDALDLIEFANGDVNTKWGSLRAKMGHPQSFNLEMIAIGNEQWESDYVDVAPRYMAFEEAIHKVYPQMKLLGTAGPFVKHELYDIGWNFYRDNAKSNPNFCYAVDEHYYVAPEWLYQNVDFYDDYPRDVAVFAGEYAAHDLNLTNSVESALAEAAMMTGMEKNGDVVKLASYAPLFNRIGHSQWTPDLIWFNEESVVYTPNYYVQKIFSDYAGSKALQLDGQDKKLREQKLYVSAVLDDDEKIIVKVVNASEEEQTLNLTDEKGQVYSGECEKVLMQASNGKAKLVVQTEAVDTNDGNKGLPGGDAATNFKMCELRKPEATSYIISKIHLNGKVSLPPKTITVLRFEKKN